MNNNDFKDLFGVSSQQIKNVCLFTPFLSKGLLASLGIKQMHRGGLYSVGHNESLSLILTGMGAPFVGDAVLWCQKTPCQICLFLGACGLVEETNDLQIGSLVIPVEAVAWESFTMLLHQIDQPAVTCLPDPGFVKTMTRISGKPPVPMVKCASVGSFYLEPDLKPLFLKNGIQALDMECCAFLAAAKTIKRRSLAILYVTDILGYPLPTLKTRCDYNSSILPAGNLAIKLIQQFVKISE